MTSTHHTSDLTEPIRNRIRAGEPCHTGEEIDALLKRVLGAMTKEEREAALWIGVKRVLHDVMRTERSYILQRLDRMEVSEARFSGYDAPYLTLQEAQEILQLCESYVMVDKNRRRAGGCSSADLRLVAEDHREQAERAQERARLYDQLADDMDAARAATLDDLVRLRSAAS